MAIPEPISFWNFDESSGNAVDALGVNTLTNNNAATFVAGKINNAADLESGSSQSFSIADASQTGLDFSGDFSASVWLKFEQLPSTAASPFQIISKSDGSNGRSYTINFQSDDKIEATCSESGNYGTSRRRANADSASITSGEVGTWVHFGFTFDIDTGAWVLYKNGSSIASTASNAGTVSAILDNTTPFEVGCTNFVGSEEQFYDGMIDMLGVWDSTLSGTDMSDLYNAGAGIQYPFTGGGGGAKLFQLLGVGT